MSRIAFFGIILVLILGTGSGYGQQCKLTASASQSVLRTDERQNIFVKVGVTGFEIKAAEKRTPLNVAIVLDRSGSMNGSKIRQAKEAARCVVEQLNENDVLSLILYSDEAEVTVPATKVTDRNAILAKIDAIEAGGMTALFDGTTQGIAEVKKFYDKERVNRVILLSDGLANVGPSGTGELKELGTKSGSDGIAVTTFGLGESYNEDLMLALAAASDGNHVFITNDSNMPEVFNAEFKFAAQVVAQDVQGTFIPGEEIKVLRCLNRDIDRDDNQITFRWNQLYSAHERYVILEVEVPASSASQERTLGTARISYRNMVSRVTDELSSVAKVRFSDSREECERSVDKEVTQDAALMLANLENARALSLRDAGKVTEAKEVLEKNKQYLNEVAGEIGGSARLKAAAELNSVQADTIESDDSWTTTGRKAMRAFQGSTNTQSVQQPVR
ncbi:MAG: VWA domain-containing protein [Planctomycetia bacterium]|nr:VWA domain-containing protein [Planctomycetia bacterium]